MLRRLCEGVFHTLQSTLPLSGVCVRVDKRVWWEVSASCASAGWGVITVGGKSRTRPAHLWSSQVKNVGRRGNVTRVRTSSKFKNVTHQTLF